MQQNNNSIIQRRKRLVHLTGVTVCYMAVFFLKLKDCYFHCVLRTVYEIDHACSLVLHRAPL